jgi:hypothetical protein
MMSEDPERSLDRRAVEGLRGDLYGLQSDLEVVQHQIAQLATRGDIWRIGLVIAAGAVVAAVIAVAIVLWFLR